MLRRFALLLLACAASSCGVVQLVSSSANGAEPVIASSSIALKLGSRGAQVTALQSRLQKLGLYSGSIDGQYGDSTKSAVEAFQRSAGLTVDGRVGAETWQQLELAALTPVATPAAVEPSPTPVATAATIDASGLALMLLGCIGAGGVFYLVRRRQQPVPLAIVATGDSSAMLQIQPEQPATKHLTIEGAAQTNGHRDRTEAIELDPTIQETTRLPKFDLATELLNDLHSSDPVLRRKAIWELGQRGESQAIQPLVDLLIDSDSQQRSLILAAIAEIGSRTLKPLQRALMISLQDESADVRKNAIRDLTRIYDSIAQTSQLLTHALNDADVEVQETARWALGQLNRIRTTAGAEDVTVLLTNPVSELDDRSTSSQ